MPYQNRDDDAGLSLPSLSLPAKKSGITRASNLTGRALTGPMQKRTASKKPASEVKPQRYDPTVEAIKKMATTRNPQPAVAQPSLQQQPQQLQQPAQSYDPGFEALKKMAFTRNPQPNPGVVQSPVSAASVQAPNTSNYSALSGAFPGQTGAPQAPGIGTVQGAPQGVTAPVNVQPIAGGPAAPQPLLNQPNTPVAPVQAGGVNQPQIIPAQQGADQFSQVQPNPNGALLQPEGVIQPPTQNASLQQPQNIIPEGSIEVIRGRPGGGGNAGAGGFQVNYATPNGRGGFAPEIAAPPSPVIQGQAAQAFNQRGTAQGVQAQTNLASIANPAAQGVVQQEVLNQQNFDAKAYALQAEQAQLNQPEVKTIKDEFGAEKLVVYDKKTGTQRDIRDESAPTITSIKRDLKKQYPEATDEELDELYEYQKGL